MPVDFAALENSFAEEALDEGETAPEETEGAEPEEKAEAAPESKEPVVESDEPELVDDEAMVKIGDQTVSVKDLKAGHMMQADYTRKTQALADERKAFEGERDTLNEENEELKSWVSSLSSVDDMEFELERYFPEAFSALRERIIEQTLETQDMSERERDLWLKARRADLQERARVKDETLAEKRQNRVESVRRTAELRTTFNGWLNEIMGEVGLDPANEKHQKLVRREVATEYKGQKWTRETFEAAAKEVASVLGREPAGKKAELPPTKVGSGKAKTAGKVKTPAKKTSDTESFFDSLRRG